MAFGHEPNEVDNNCNRALETPDRHLTINLALGRLEFSSPPIGKRVTMLRPLASTRRSLLKSCFWHLKCNRHRQKSHQRSNAIVLCESTNQLPTQSRSAPLGCQPRTWCLRQAHRTFSTQLHQCFITQGYPCLSLFRRALALRLRLHGPKPIQDHANALG